MSDQQVTEIRAVIAADVPALSLQLRALAWLDERRLQLRRGWRILRGYPAALRRAHRNAVAIAAIGDTLDALGVPRTRHEQTFTPVERLHLFVDRISSRLQTQVDNNMEYHTLCKEVLMLLEGAPNAGNFRTRTAIEKLRAITLPVGATGLILPS